MPEFLSATWIDEFADAVAGIAVAADHPIGAVRFVVDGSGADFRFVVEPPAVRIEHGRDPLAAVPETVVRCDAETAAAVALGTTNAQTRLAAGRLRLAGDVRALGALAALGPAVSAATADLRARTRYPTP
ncbi:MAG: hypothetical protein ACKO1Y_02545 [Actinomycetota bacterium]